MMTILSMLFSPVAIITCMQCFALQVINTKESEYIFWLYQMDYCFKDIKKFYVLGMLQGLHPSQPDCGSF